MKLFLLAFFINILLSPPSFAEQTAQPVFATETTTWQPLTLETALGKALSFEMVSSLGEAAVFLVVYGGAVETYGLVFAVSLATASAAYILHDYAWEGILTHIWLQPDGQPMARDNAAVIASKAASYRVVSSSRSFVVGNWLGAADLALSASFALGVAALDTAVYIANEYLFAWLGQPIEPAISADKTSG